MYVNSNEIFMPELPEVETIKNDLTKRILNKKIRDIEIRKKKIVRNKANLFLKTLINNEFSAIDRIGKLLIFSLRRNNEFLLIHLKMTGQLIYCQQGKFIVGGHSLPKIGTSLPNKYSHVIFTFADNSKLFFNDLRQFGYLEIVDEEKLKKIKSQFGIEPLTKEFKLPKLEEIFKKKSTLIKAVLMDQGLIAGIGNIYADEILFAAQINPNHQAKNLNKKEVVRIYKASSQVIRTAIKHRGTTFNDYTDADGNVGSFAKFLKVYGRAGEKCYRCGSIVKKIKMAGRGTHFCPTCQR
ncbi:MAG: bifunctional DNA-formamidopyrimidine glycosylase/DNA-(apurinic or apyrimidinic site) lyase [Candidatus Falkowbacteria bacterium]|nr:bifunctional DNA-formamidopyrimidine glycosylase/DNA-(apurinic or apyrimidinic site) lyase [Candidatus Falkowbacteria bacterium]